MRCFSFAIFFLFGVLVSCPAYAAEDGVKSGTLLAAFGTSMESAMPALNAIGSDYEKAGKPVVWAYTSDIIRKKLAQSGTKVLSVSAAMDECARRGVQELRIQSLHMSGGEEYSQLERAIVRNLERRPGRFKRVLLGHPLLESERDLNEVVSAVLADIAAERQPGDAVVFMGHGNDRGPGDLALAAVRDALHDKDPLAFLATVEGAHDFARVIPELRRLGVKRVWLQPFMIVAGDHANNDMAGDEEDSWASQLKKEGLTPLPRLKGLGEIAGVSAVFLRHTAETTDDLAHSKKED